MNPERSGHRTTTPTVIGKGSPARFRLYDLRSHPSLCARHWMRDPQRLSRCFRGNSPPRHHRSAFRTRFAPMMDPSGDAFHDCRQSIKPPDKRILFCIRTLIVQSRKGKNIEGNTGEHCSDRAAQNPNLWVQLNRKGSTGSARSDGLLLPLFSPAKRPTLYRALRDGQFAPA